MSPDAMIMYAPYRHDELLQEAAQQRLVRAARVGRADSNGRLSQVAIVRHLMGVRPERRTCRLQGCIPSCSCA